MSRKCSQHFHDLFNTVVLKGSVLGIVEHFYFKKEYYMRGASCMRYDAGSQRLHVVM